jgi:hypothetical protein
LCRKFETDADAKKILDLERTSATDGIKGMGTYIQHNTSSSRKVGFAYVPLKCIVVDLF